jgi:hypothetical protein
MTIIDDKYELRCAQGWDISEHLPTLKRYASECDSVTEMGVRFCVSLWAFLAGRPKHMVSVDIVSPDEFNDFYGARLSEIYSACEDEKIDFKFILGSTLDIKIEPTDLLFVDTDHTYTQLSQELKLHGNKAKKYIILHDTESCKLELQPAINEFLLSNPEWHIKEVFINNNGLTVLERIAK